MSDSKKGRDGSQLWEEVQAGQPARKKNPECLMEQF